jgi:hypothetical protein
VNFERIAELAGDLMALKFFPTDDGGRLAIMKLIGQMCSDEDQVRWLVARTLTLCDEWPGPRTFRAIFCKRYKPVDGVDLRMFRSENFPDGIPNEKPEILTPLLPPGHESSAAPKLEAAIEQTAAELQMPPARLIGRSEREFSELLEETITAPQDRQVLPREQPTNPNYRPITREDIERAEMEHRAKKNQSIQ